MKKKFFVLLIILSCFSLVVFLWWYQAEKAPNPKDTAMTIFSIEKGENIKNIADRLEKQGFIRSPLAFFLLARFGGFSQRIQAGDFRLSTSMDLQTVIESLTHGTVDTWIVIPEGWRSEEIALKLARELNIPEREFLHVAKEGYMFPDTYLFPKDATAGAVAKTMMDNFDKKADERIRTLASKKNLTLTELITIASLVEREAKFSEDRPLIASVILNRRAIGMKLDIDATVQYALGYQSQEKTWWKKDLTTEDLRLDSPYNTYIHSNLPPTPITNPGIAAIEAVVTAPSTSYIYYIADKTGKSHFAQTLEEHTANIAKYLN
ncbi:endolytic transglycosylase MltG [Candidatus Gottesmanbacteria bacterium]|nr:endolytic transglycosylase MltG [Candidatus Gottesmanbacteria bacterium]